MKKIKILILSLAICMLGNGTIVKAIDIKYDYNKDGIVDIKDIAEISKFYSTNNTIYDLNKDGIVDIYDITQISKTFDNSVFKIYNGNGEFIKGYNKGALLTAITEASKLSNGFVMSNGKLTWDSNSYWIYDGENLIKSESTALQAVNLGESLTNGKVVTKLGTLLLDKASNIKNSLGVVNVTDYVNFRQGPSTSTSILGRLYNNTLVTVDRISIAPNFLSITWFKNDQTNLSGYVYYPYIDIIQDDANQSFLGYIAAKNESGLNAGRISDNPNDLGGASFGAFQFASKVGSVSSFMTWLSGKDAELYKKLNDAKILDESTYGEALKYSVNFKAAWTEIANQYYERFYKLQLQYTKSSYYDMFLYYTNKNGYNTTELLKYNSTRNMIMSTSIQHGPSGAYQIFSKVGPVQDMNQFIDRIYEERLNRSSTNYPPGSSIYEGLKRRFQDEADEIKRVYSREISF